MKSNSLSWKEVKYSDRKVMLNTSKPYFVYFNHHICLEYFTVGFVILYTEVESRILIKLWNWRHNMFKSFAYMGIIGGDDLLNYGDPALIYWPQCLFWYCSSYLTLIAVNGNCHKWTCFKIYIHNNPKFIKVTSARLSVKTGKKKKLTTNNESCSKMLAE